jgi:hypothetical protein
MDRVEPITGAGLRTPRAAAVAGILFSVLLGLALVLIIVSAPSDPAKAGAWLADPARRTTVAVALNLVPFAGIAFLWFIGVVRDRIGQLEDRFFGSVFLGSGLLFVAMLFAGAAFAGGLIAEVAAGSTAAPGPDTLAVGRQVTTLLLRVYAMRMAAVFTLSTATITLRTRVVPRWIGMLGIAVAVVLLVSVGLTVWVELLFPAWILLLSVDILRTGLRRSPAAASGSLGRDDREGGVGMVGECGDGGEGLGVAVEPDTFGARAAEHGQQLRAVSVMTRSAGSVRVVG